MAEERNPPRDMPKGNPVPTLTTLFYAICRGDPDEFSWVWAYAAGAGEVELFARVLSELSQFNALDIINRQALAFRAKLEKTNKDISAESATTSTSTAAGEVKTAQQGSNGSTAPKSEAKSVSTPGDDVSGSGKKSSKKSKSGAATPLTLPPGIPLPPKGIVIPGLSPARGSNSQPALTPIAGSGKNGKASKAEEAPKPDPFQELIKKRALEQLQKQKIVEAPPVEKEKPKTTKPKVEKPEKPVIMPPVPPPPPSSSSFEGTTGHADRANLKGPVPVWQHLPHFLHLCHVALSRRPPPRRVLVSSKTGKSAKASTTDEDDVPVFKLVPVEPALVQAARMGQAHIVSLLLAMPWANPEIFERGTRTTALMAAMSRFIGAARRQPTRQRLHVAKYVAQRVSDDPVLEARLRQVAAMWAREGFPVSEIVARALQRLRLQLQQLSPEKDEHSTKTQRGSSVNARAELEETLPIGTPILAPLTSSMSTTMEELGLDIPAYPSEASQVNTPIPEYLEESYFSLLQGTSHAESAARGAKALIRPEQFARGLSSHAPSSAAPQPTASSPNLFPLVSSVLKSHFEPAYCKRRHDSMSTNSSEAGGVLPEERGSSTALEGVGVGCVLTDQDHICDLLYSRRDDVASNLRKIAPPPALNAGLSWDRMSRGSGSQRGSRRAVSKSRQGSIAGSAGVPEGVATEYFEDDTSAPIPRVRRAKDDLATEFDETQDSASARRDNVDREVDETLSEHGYAGRGANTASHPGADDDEMPGHSSRNRAPGPSTRFPQSSNSNIYLSQSSKAVRHSDTRRRSQSVSRERRVDEDFVIGADQISTNETDQPPASVGPPQQDRDMETMSGGSNRRTSLKGTLTMRSGPDFSTQSNHPTSPIGTERAAANLLAVGSSYVAPSKPRLIMLPDRISPHYVQAVFGDLSKGPQRSGIEPSNQGGNLASDPAQRTAISQNHRSTLIHVVPENAPVVPENAPVPTLPVNSTADTAPLQVQPFVDAGQQTSARIFAGQAQAEAQAALSDAEIELSKLDPIVQDALRKTQLSDPYVVAALLYPTLAMPALIHEYTSHVHSHSIYTPERDKEQERGADKSLGAAFKEATVDSGPASSPAQSKAQPGLPDLSLQLSPPSMTINELVPLPLTPSFVKSKFVAAVMDLPETVDTAEANPAEASIETTTRSGFAIAKELQIISPIDAGKGTGKLRIRPDAEPVPVAGPSLTQPVIPLPTVHIDLPAPPEPSPVPHTQGSTIPDVKEEVPRQPQQNNNTTTQVKVLSSNSNVVDVVEAPVPMPLPHPDFVADLLAKGVSARPVFSQLRTTMLSSTRSKSQSGNPSVPAARTALTDIFDTIVTLVGHGCRLDARNRESLNVFGMVPTDALNRLGRWSIRLGLVRLRARYYVIRATLRAQILPMLWKVVPRFSPRDRPGLRTILDTIAEKQESERQARESNRIGAKNPAAAPKIKFTYETAKVGKPNELAGRAASAVAAGLTDFAAALKLTQQLNEDPSKEADNNDDDNFGAGYESFDGPPPEVDSDALAVTDIILDLVCSYVGQDKYTTTSTLPIRGSIVPLLGTI